MNVGDIVVSKYTGVSLRVARVTERFVYCNKVDGKPWKANSRFRREDLRCLPSSSRAEMPVEELDK
jgi:hypothetical protein